MPSLIKAVRPEPYLYGVAMKIFLDMEHYFILSKKITASNSKICQKSHYVDQEAKDHD
jgi:hypothetical protein